VTAAGFVARTSWMGYWQLMRRYHQFEVRGLHHILGRGPAMIVGYHGRPGCRDLIMLQALLLNDYGLSTRAVAHDIVFKIPGLAGLADAFAFVSRAPEAVAKVVARGDKLVVAPGGLEEAWGSFRDSYRVKWGNRTGYLRLAIRHKLPIIPVAASGVDSAFYGLFDAYRFWKKMGVPPGMGIWLGLGPFGLWPMTPPFPSRIIQHVGEPIELGDLRLDEECGEDRLTRLHLQISATVQQLLDRARAEARGRPVVSEREKLQWINELEN
jgi:1-acyl-sn-glycerol-3-phosphate acyltransferase